MKPPKAQKLQVPLLKADCTSGVKLFPALVDKYGAYFEPTTPPPLHCGPVDGFNK